MTAPEILASLRSLGAELSVMGDRIKVTASAGALTPDMRAKIAAHKSELLELLKQRQQIHTMNAPQLVPFPRGDKLPLSLFQQRLWILEQLQPDTIVRFNMVTLWVMQERDIALLQRAIVDVVRRHEILRSVIRSEHGTPYVKVLSPESATVECSDLRELPGTEQRRRIDAEVRAAITQSFDLTAEPPVRWHIYITAGGQLTIRLCASHIAVDEWSFVLLRKELDLSLQAGAAGMVLAPPALQYSDYAEWERRRQSSDAVASQLAWWQRRLANLPGVCVWPPDARGGSPTGGALRFSWDGDFTARLRELALTRRSTLFMVLLSALAALLRAGSGRGDIAVGTSFGVREQTELETMIGGFVNVVVLRLDLDDNPSFADLLARARDTVLDAHEHRDVSFEMLVERLNPIRSLDFAPLFQVSVVMHNATAAEPSQIYSGGAIQHMTWFARDTETGLHMSLEYRSDLYHIGTMERVARHLESLLRAAVEDPLRPVSRLTLLTPEERQMVTAGFNATRVSLDPAPMSIQFERQVALTPEATALRYRNQTSTYDALNRRANQIARHLLVNGAKRGDLVGICLDRCADLLACLLAVAKTGAAYVPLDPGFPAARLTFMVEQSGLTLVVVDRRGQSAFPASVHVLNLEDDAAAIDGCAAGNLSIVPNADDPVYVIYTSGSTGRPNGVAVSHASLANFLGAMLREPGLADTDILAAVTTVSFDIAGLELFLPLLAGARVVMVPHDVATDGVALATLLAEERVTIMQATPATWRLLVEARWPGTRDFAALCGGDALTVDLSRAVLARVGALWNLYGPTETTIWSTTGRVEPDHDSVTIGRPIANTQVYILDPVGQPTPIGVAGEIWIGGAGIASGYWRNAELTGRKFLPDPFSNQDPGAMMYRTGDMGRWRADGRIAHLGRIDQQVKLRGFRIEPGEIEAALAAHAAIRESVVVMRGDTPERERLVAYIVYRPGLELTTTEVREHLRTSLPEYMVPSAFVAIGAVPWTPNGKVDRRALPDPFRLGSTASTQYVPPAAGAEQLLARIWADALAVERVGAADNFFDLGGHSLLSLRVAATIHERTGWRMPPHIMFQKTLRQIATALDAHENGSGLIG